MAVTTFIPTIWSARLVANLEKSHVATNLVNRDYEGEIRQQGDKVKINSFGDITINDYEKNVNIADPEELTTADQTMEITEAKYYNYQVDDVDRAQMKTGLMDKAQGKAAYKLADASDTFLFSTMAAGVDAGNFVGTSVEPIALTADNVYQNFVNLRKVLDKANVRTDGRFVAIPPDVYALLLLDKRFAEGGGAKAEEVVRNGLVGNVAGLNVYNSNNVVEANGTFSIVAGIADATTYAEQIVKTEAYRMEKRFSDAVKGLHVYGAKVTDGKKLAKLFATVA